MHDATGNLKLAWNAARWLVLSAVVQCRCTAVWWRHCYAAEAVLEKIDLLKKSILARAFRGELGTNDHTEESALELLRASLN